MDRYKASRYFPDRKFPLVCLRYHRHGAIPVHHHEFHELVVILAGRGMHVTDGVPSPIEAGDVFLIRKGTPHEYRDPSRLELVNILFDSRRLRLPLDRLADSPGYHMLFHVEPSIRQIKRSRHRLRLPPNALSEAAGLIARLQKELDGKTPGYRFSAIAYFMNLIDFLARHYFSDPQARHEPHRKMSEVLGFIEEHVAESIRLKTLTRVAGMSKSALAREFHTVMGCSPIEHVIRVRIVRAAELLRHPGARVTETAFACGFADSNYFARRFRKIMGVSPSHYRISDGQPRGVRP